MQVRTLTTTDPDWKSYLSGARHDIFHIPEYLRAEDAFRGTTTQLLVVEEGDSALLVPLVFSSLPGGLRDASSPFRHAGPLFTTSSTRQWRGEAVSAALRHLRDAGVVSLFLRAHPLFGLDEFAAVGTIVEHGPTFVIPLDRSLDEIKGGMRQNHRRNMRKAERAGHVAELDSGWEHLDEFHWIYTKTMDRLEARPDYRFTREYFESLRDDVGDLSSLWVLRMDGELAGAHAVTECNGTVQYLLGATHPDFYQKVPQVAIFDAVLQWAHARGNTDYFLGGGLQESLLHFKAGFTRTQRPAATGRIVVNHAEYDRLCSAWESTNGPFAEGEDSFFPGYRTPPAPAV